MRHEAVGAAVGRALDGRASANLRSLATLSRIGIGGNARLVQRATGLDDLRRAAEEARAGGWPLLVIGAGSNVLFADEDYPGTVVRLCGELARIAAGPAPGGFSVGAGVQMRQVGLAAAGAGLDHAAFLAAIPGTVGGGVRMNAGVPGVGEMADVVETVTALDVASGRLRCRSREECRFVHRNSVFSGTREIVVGVDLRFPLAARSSLALLGEIRALAERRRACQPRNPRTLGSTFKRPAGAEPAGVYLDRVGMRGMRRGGAMVALEHANWILNEGGATARDVKELMAIGSRRVRENFGVALEREIVFLPQDWCDGY